MPAEERRQASGGQAREVISEGEEYMSILTGLRPGQMQRHAKERRVLEGLARPEKFRELISREVNRADRIGMPCSMVEFRLSGRGEQHEATLTHLAWVLRQRARATDEVGLLREGVIAAVLPHTPPEGARLFAEDVCASLEQDMQRPRYALYSYPYAGPQDGEAEPEAVRPMQSLLVDPLPTWKRVLDIAGAGVGLIMSAPIVAAAAALTRLTSPGPAFYLQKRAGLGGTPFTIYKLRTMVMGAETKQEQYRKQSEQDGPAFKIRNDPRVTRLGRFLRKTSIDELPQFWNVFKGDMTLVGPRPMDCKEVAKCEAWHRHRHRVTPGLTCIWQVRGRSRVSFADWMRMDMQYLRLSSFLLDLRLLVLTVPAVLLRRGAC
jgi:lipopolysaccharide/colanic/teichoic acid biosynthesis glycosyltransferase